MARLAESGQVRPDLDQDRGGAAEVEAGHGLQQAQGFRVVRQADGQAPIQFCQAAVDGVAGRELVAEPPERVGIEAGRQRFGQQGQLRPDMVWGGGG